MRNALTFASTVSRQVGKLSLALMVALAATPAVAQVAAPWLEFTGPASGWVEVPDSPALNPTSAITIEAWVYLRSEAVYGISGCCGAIVGKGFAQGYAFELSSVGTWLRFYATGSATSVLSEGDVEVGRWNHVAVTYDGTTTRFYVNGNDAGTSTDMSGPVLVSNYPLTIGHDTGFDGTPDGFIDEVRLWNIARSRADIVATMGLALNAPQAGLVAVWHLDGDGSDAVGGHDGSLVGGARFTGGTAPGCPFEAFVPAGGHLPGVPPTQWVTDMSLLNLATSTGDVTVQLLPRDRDNSAPASFATSIPPRASLRLPDVVLSRFGEANLAAAFRICSNVQLLVASRTYNQAASGTFGQGIPGETRSAAVSTDGEPRYLTGLHENSAYRTNVGFTNTANVQATAIVELFDADGTELGSKSYVVPPYGTIQRNRMFTEVTTMAVTSGSLRVTATGGAVLVYASVVDSVTGDPTYMLAR